MLVRFKQDTKVRAIGKKGEYLKEFKGKQPYKIAKIKFDSVTVTLTMPNGVIIPSIGFRTLLTIAED